eukprot:TRINITY_DN5005_c0_g1_i1.p1 TRINITY_DN5005_c0_g1~~TRINITY_DN5005_c0_g1_i1.p1  ORF type:complete len:499 (+),score=94.48 TRINITY_DN5005_c0_g1_i1:86-1498(+)
MSTAWEVVYAFFAVSQFALATSSFFWFSSHRDHPVITNRGFWSSSISIWGLVISGVSGCLGMAFGDVIPCASIHITGDMGIAAHMFFLWERCLMLIVCFEISVQSKAYGEAKQDNVDSVVRVSWLMRHRSWFHHDLNAPTKVIAMVLTGMSWIFQLSMIGAYPKGAVSKFNSDECTQFSKVAGMLTAGLLFISIPVLFESSRRMFKLRENFHIREELKVYATNTALAVIWVSISFLSNATNIQPSLAYYVIIPFGAVYAGFTRVVRRVLEYEKRSEKDSRAIEGDSSTGRGLTGTLAASNDSRAEVPSQLQTPQQPSAPKPRTNYVKALKEIMSDPQILPLFEKFMTYEFAIENVLFLKAVEQFRRSVGSKSVEETLKNAQSIYDRFCDQNSRLTINISAQVRRDLKNALMKIGDEHGETKTLETVFSAAEEEILMLIAQDSVRRFLRSSEYCAVAAKPTAVNTQVAALP